eukprot:CAMPEP_0178425842 /NCGR_PEP_ID=MMETSP0689_2-20121128/28928_1 /TAXON_ID=160604 /ORGANISM="Amphidinium massartii, Strain CS-259" /LENGTH=1108 /DNA_ID=CAMNT_0020047511 /DNA_START=62 /DNA_END=3385 /DNA_ORIENTATION=+
MAAQVHAHFDGAAIAFKATGQSTSDDRIDHILESTDYVRSSVQDLVKLNQSVVLNITELQQEVKNLQQAFLPDSALSPAITTSYAPSMSARPLSTAASTRTVGGYSIPATLPFRQACSNVDGTDSKENGHRAYDEARGESPSGELKLHTGISDPHCLSRRSRRSNTTVPTDLLVSGHGMLSFEGEAVDQEVLSAAGQASAATSVDKGQVAERLPRGWPRSLRPRAAHGEEESVANHVVAKDMKHQITGQESDPLFPRADKLFFRRCCSNGFVVMPGSPVRMAWDVTCVMLVMYDLTVIPWTLAWDAEVDAITAGLWCTVSFWTMDIFLSSITGYHKQGVLIKRPREIFKRYATTWMPADIFVVACDWFSIIVLVAVPENKSAGTLKLLRFAKLGRLLRIMDMLRTLRFLRALDEIMERFFIEAYRVILQITKVLLGCLWCLHVMSCGWYALGRWGPTDTGLRWVDYLSTDTGAHEYFSSFQWSVAQLTLGGMDIPSTNTWERGYTIVCLLFGLVFGSTLISALSASMVDFQMTQKDRNEKLSVARRYLRENLVGAGMSQRVQQQIIERLNERTRLMDSEVQGLTLLARSLRLELRYEIAKNHLEQHPLLFVFASLDLALAQQMSESALSIRFARNGDDVFVAAQEAAGCFYVRDGDLDYSQTPDSAPVEFPTEVAVRPSTWLAEAGLWCCWIHVGTLTAHTPSEIFAIDADELVKVADKNSSIRSMLIQYSSQYYRRVVSAQPPLADWPSDLKVPLTEFPSIVLAMPRETQLAIGMCALDFMQVKKQRKVTEKLRNEVMSGKSVAVVDGNGEVCRVVMVIVLRIEHPDGYVLAHVGKCSDGKLSAQCQLPGGKQEKDEVVTEAVERLLEAKLEPLVGLVHLSGLELRTSEKPSKEHGVRTKYLRHVCVMRPLAGLEGLGWEVERESTLPNGQTSRLMNVMPPDSPLGDRASKAIVHTQSQKSMSSAVPSLTPSQLRLDSRAVYSVPEKGKAETSNFYAWFRDSEIDFYSGNGEAHLQEWLVRVQARRQAALAPAVVAVASTPDGPGSRENTLPIQEVASDGCDGAVWDLDESGSPWNTLWLNMALADPLGEPRQALRFELESNVTNWL